MSVECAFRTRVSVSEMCLQNESHGYWNVPSERESWLGEFAFRERVMVRECAFRTRVIVSGMCTEKHRHGYGNVPRER